MPTPNQGELARAINHDPDESWPSIIEIVAYWSDDGSRRGLRRSIRISADEFYGRGQYGAPMQGDRLVKMIEQLRIKKG